MNPFTLRYTDKQVIFMKLGQDTDCGESVWEAQEIKEGRVVRVHYQTVEDDSTPQKIAEALGYFNTPIDGIYGSYNKVTFKGVTYIRQINFPRQWDAFRDDKWIGGFSLYQDDPKPTDLESALNFIEKVEHVPILKNFDRDGIEYQRLHGECHGWVARGNGHRVAMDLEGRDDTKDSIVQAFSQHPGFPRLKYVRPEEKRTSLEMVKEFHEKFDHPVHDFVHIGDQKVNHLRVKLLREEIQELDDALAVGDEKEVLDALSDIQYVLDGAFLALGFHRIKDEAISETHSSNMSKLGPDGLPVKREDGKILKGPNFREPDYSKILEKI